LICCDLPSAIRVQTSNGAFAFKVNILAFNRFQNVGSASARVLIDLSQVEQSVAQFRSLAQQIGDSIRQINASIATVQGGGSVIGGGSRKEFSSNTIDAAVAAQQKMQTAVQQTVATQSQLTQRIQETTVARQRNTEEAQKQFQIAQAMVGQIRSQVAEQANLYRTATANAPQTVSRRDVETQLRSARQPIVDLQNQLQRLRVAYAAATTPEARNALVPELQRIQTEARAAGNAMQPLRQSVTEFSNAVQSSRSGVTGYFNSVRENIEKINETSLAANLQEISFRLLPLGAAAAALTARGVQTAQSIQEATLSFRAFAGSAQEADKVMASLREQASRFGQPVQKTLATMQQFAPLFRDAGVALEDVYNLAVRLATLNPLQGVDRALFSINEALASGGGDLKSLVENFGIGRQQLRGFIEEAGVTEGLDQFLNSMGRTTELAEQFGQTSRAAITRFQDSVDRFLASSMDNFLGGMSDAANSASEFFNRLAEGPPIIGQVVGGLLSITSAGTTALITVGQMALAFSSIRGVIAPLNINLANVVSNIGRLASSGNLATLARVGATGVSVAAGASIGLDIAAGMGTPGINTRQDALDRLIQAMTIPIAGITKVISTLVAILHNAGELLGAAFHNIGVTLAGVGGFFSDILIHVGAVIANAIGGIETAIGNALQGIGDFLAQAGIHTGIGLTGVELVGQGVRRQEAVAATLNAPIESVWDRIAPQLTDLAEMALLPTEAQQAEAQANANRIWVDAYNVLASILGGTAIPLPGTGVPAGGGGGLGGGAGFQITSDQLEEIQDLMQQITEMQRESVLQQQRQLEDRVLAAQREMEDVMIARSRAIDNFNQQQGRAQDDYNRSRAQSIEDFERQLAQTEDQSRQQRAKQQDDFNKQMLRAQEDHLRSMIRMARDVDSAISARNFLAAQDQIQKMRDAEEDFNIEQQRKREDYTQQMQELDANLKAQQDQRRADFERQLKRQEENFQLQRQRQINDFARQQNLEEEDRRRRLARQAQDFVIQQRRQEEDFNRRIDAMISHNEAVNSVWRNGLLVLRNATQEFFNGLPPMLQSILNTFTGRGGSNTGAGAANAGNNYNYYGAPSSNQLFSGVISSSGSLLGLPPVTGYQPNSTNRYGQTTPFQEGSWFVPSTMSARVHRGEIIIPETFANAVRRGEMSIGGSSGDIQINVPLQVINAQGMDEERLANVVRDRVVGEIAHELEERKRRNQPMRGMTG